jgi:hypothetical protein
MGCQDHVDRLGLALPAGDACRPQRCGKISALAQTAQRRLQVNTGHRAK